MSSQTSTEPAVILHGGAGNITRQNLSPSAYALYTTFLLRTHRSTTDLLAKGASALDAATHAVTLFEDCTLFNCGKGAVFTRDGRIELEASVMVTRNYRKRACGVVLVNQVKNPIKLAREMLIHGEQDGSGPGNGGDDDPSGGSGGAQGHCCLGGKTAHQLAKEWKLEMVGESYFWTRKRWEQHRKGLGKRDGEEERLGLEWGEEEPGWDGKEYLPQGTVGCVALDQYGTMCVATSTGGLTNKLPCRIGDTPTIGAGFWAEEWDESPLLRQSQQQLGVSQLQNLGFSPLTDMIADNLRHLLGDCFPNFVRYHQVAQTYEKQPQPRGIRAVALSGTGNGDSFLRLCAARTAGAMVRFSPKRTLASAVNQVAGPGGELQMSAGDRWQVTGEGEGGIIGIELVEGRGEVVFDFNCRGMFRCWVDERGVERVMVFRDEY